MSTIDLRELAKSLMFAEKAKEEAEELRRDNERLYEITVEHAKRFEKDQQTILDLKQTILNLERKVQFLEEGIENLSGALTIKQEKYTGKISEIERQNINLVRINENLGDELEKYKRRYEAVREILAPIWSEKI